MSRFLTSSYRCLLMALLVVPGLAGTGGHAAAAQRDRVDPASYESELSGIEIDVTGDEFEIYEAEVQDYSHGQGEIVEIASNTAYVQVAFFDDTDTNQETLEIYNEGFSGEVDDFEVLDEGEDGDTVYTFAVATYEGVEFYYYLAVTADVEDNVDVLQRIFATDATFFDDLAEAQDVISIDRDGFLEGVEVADLEELVGAEQGRGGEPTEEPEEEPTDEPGDQPTEEPAEAVPTIDPAGAAVRELVVVDADLVTTSEVAVGPGGAEAPAYEEIPMQYGDGEAILVFLMRPYSPEATLDLVLSLFTPEGGSLQNLGTDADQTSAWSLDLVESPQGSHLLYVQVQSDRYERFHFTEILFAPVDALPETMQGFSENVQVGGVPMFHDADLETLEWLLGGGEEPDARDEQEDDEQQDDKRGEEEEAEGEESGQLDLESQGLASETEYISPQYDVTVEWDDAAWVVDTEWENSAVSDPESGIDSVILFSSELNASVMVQVLASDGREPEEYVEGWESDEYLAEYIHEDGEVLVADSGSDSGGVAYLTYDAEGEPLVLTQEVHSLDDEVVAIVMMYSTLDTVADAYGDAEDFITVDGNDAAVTFTPRELERAANP